MMHRATSVGLMVLTVIVACTHLKTDPSKTVSPTARAATGEPHDAASAADKSPVSASSGAAAEAAPANISVVEPGASVSTPSQLKPVVPDAVRPKAPRTSVPAKSAASERATPPQFNKDKAAEKPITGSLNLASLEQRLRDTQAIGVFTKLSLKNQVNDLLEEFRAFHSGQSKSSLAELRQRYNLLLLKVLTLLQDSDAPLASAISASREAIWGVLADREKFQKI